MENSVWTLIKDSSLSRWREKHNLNVNFAPSRSLDSPPLFDYNKFRSSLLMATPLSINRISTLKNSEVRKRHRSSSIDFGEKSLRRLRSSKKNSRRFLISPNIFTRLWFEGGEAERTVLIAFPAQFTFNQRESPLATLRAICLPLKSPLPLPFFLPHTSSLFSLHRARFEPSSYVPCTEYVKPASRSFFDSIEG